MHQAEANAIFSRFKQYDDDPVPTASGPPADKSSEKPAENHLDALAAGNVESSLQQQQERSVSDATPQTEKPRGRGKPNPQEAEIQEAISHYQAGDSEPVLIPFDSEEEAQKRKHALYQAVRGRGFKPKFSVDGKTVSLQVEGKLPKKKLKGKKATTKPKAKKPAPTAQTASAVAGPFILRTYSSKTFQEESFNDLDSTKAAATQRIFSGTPAQDLLILQAHALDPQLQLNLVTPGNATPSMGSAPRPKARKGKKPGPKAAGKKGKRGRTKDMPGLIRSTLKELGGQASLAQIRDHLWKSGKTEAASEKSLYNSINQAVNRYPEFEKVDRGVVGLKG